MRKSGACVRTNSPLSVCRTPPLRAAVGYWERRTVPAPSLARLVAQFVPKQMNAITIKVFLFSVGPPLLLRYKRDPNQDSVKRLPTQSE